MVESIPLQMVLVSILNYDVGLHLFNLRILWDTTSVFICIGGNCDILHQIGEKVPNVIYVWASLNLVDMS